MMTYEHWTGDLGTFLQPGAPVAKAQADYFLEVPPPASWDPTLIQIGEVQDHNGPNHCARFSMLQKTRKGWAYPGAQPRGGDVLLAGGAS